MILTPNLNKENTRMLLSVSHALASDDPTLWYVTRAAAISAYILLALAVIVGQLRSAFRSTGSRAPWLIWLLDEGHQYIAALAAVFVALHLVTLLFDPVVPFTVVNLLLPLDEPYRATAVNLGVFGLYALVAVLLSSWLRRALSYGFWRALHFVSFLVFALITLHGILAGADSSQPWMQAVYGVAAGLVVALMGLRLLISAFAGGSRQAAA